MKAANAESNVFWVFFAFFSLEESNDKKSLR